MPAIEQSGYYVTLGGQPFLVTQSCSGCNLIAGKNCLFRLFMVANTLPQVDSMLLKVNGPSGPFAAFVPKGLLLLEWAAPNGPSVGLIVRGFAFPRSGKYSIDLSVRDIQGAVLASVSSDLLFHATKDLRLLVVYSFHQGFFSPQPEWDQDVQRSMERLGAMLPVRDCVQNKLNGSRNQGIRYKIGSPCDAWTKKYYECVYEQTKQINNAAGDDIDITIEFRPQQFNEGVGGNSGRPPAPYGNFRRASCVAGFWAGTEWTAPCFAQEIGHNFGLESPNSPHSPDLQDPGHSKDGAIVDPFAFDLLRKQPYPAPGRFLGDVMNNMAGGAGQGADSVLYNSYDWNQLRQELVLLDSTGTDIKPAFVDPCAPVGLTPVKPKSPHQYFQILGSVADGPQWRLGPHGPEPVPPWGPAARQKAIRGIFDQLLKEGIDTVYAATAKESMTIVTGPGPSRELILKESVGRKGRK